MKPDRLLALLLCSLLLANCRLGPAEETGASGANPPNIVLIFADDLGYGDLSCYGSTLHSTPHLDQLATEGQRLTQFYSASPVCSPSRAALLTGCYPLRVGIPHVLAPHGVSWVKERWRTGLHPDEQTLPELLKEQGYATGIFGKWHLGYRPEHLPARHGFDRFFGIPYSNDMIPSLNPAYPPLPLISDSVVVEEGPDQRQFTRRFTEEAMAFIEAHQKKPFFVYLPHPMPHIPLYASEQFEGSTGKGIYADVIAEIDWSVGQIVAKLKALGLAENTIVIFTSDNGPWLIFGDHAGMAGRLREGKSTTMEGGQRVPFIISWPGKLSAGTNTGVAVNMDLMPTLLSWAGAPMPRLPIDGQPLTKLFESMNPQAGRETFLFYHGEEVQAMRHGKWKLHQPHQYQTIGEAGSGGKMGRYQPMEISWALYDLEADPGETTDRSSEHPQLLEELKTKMQQEDARLHSGQRKPFVYEGEAPPAGIFWE